MENLLSNLETEWKANKELGLITSVADSLVKGGFNARILSDKKNGLLTTNTELVNVEDTFEIIFTKKDSMYSYIIIKGEGKIRECKNLQGIIIDADSLELIGNRRVFLNEKGKNKELRAHIKKYGKSLKLHRYLFGDPDAKEIDHVCRRSHIIIKEKLRACDSKKNMLNKPFRSEIDYQDMTFSISRIRPTNDDIKAVQDAGHHIYQVKCDAQDVVSDDYSIDSKVFSTIEELYSELNSLEKRFHGDFRYNPIFAFDDVMKNGGIEYHGLIWTYLYMQVKLLGLDEDEFIRLRKDFLKEYCLDMCKYYGIS